MPRQPPRDKDMKRRTKVEQYTNLYKDNYTVHFIVNTLSEIFYMDSREVNSCAESDLSRQ